MRYTYVFFSLSGVFFTLEWTIPQLNETVKQDKSREEPENRVLRYTVMFARAFGIFCCFCLISYHIPGSSWYTCHFIFKNLTRKSRAAVYVHVRWCFRHLLSFTLDFVSHTWQSVVYILNHVTYIVDVGKIPATNAVKH